MRRFYEWLLCLYPAEFRRRFAEEMLLVFADANDDASREGWFAHMSFALHEAGGLLCGAVGEHIHSVSSFELLFRRVAMISRNRRFRFPVAAIALMVFSFAGIVFAIHNARAIAFSLAGQTYMRHGQLYTYRPEGLSFMQTFGFAFAVTLVVAVAVWAVMHSMHRSGVHRLAEADTWPSK